MPLSDIFDTRLLSKYNGNAPRYTSYPTAAEFHEFAESDFHLAAQQSGNKNLSLYLHIPFCHSLCYYCACNKIVTRNSDKAEVYLEYLMREIVNRSECFGDHKVKQIHFGGGTPSFLSKDQFTTLMMSIRKHFQVTQDAEISIEIDPRGVDLSYLVHLKVLGFNRLSLGIQDIDPEVQLAINRVQSTEHVSGLICDARRIGFTSINVDLIYGLPKQTKETFSRTLYQMIDLNVDRVSLFSYAHLPERFAAQRKILPDWLPNPEYKFSLMKLAIETLCEAGYRFIGMDHFAKPKDELSVAADEGRLHRNFQGYTTMGECDMLGLGVSSISAIGDCLAQNHKKLADYYRALDEQDSAIAKGKHLSKDDHIRAYVIKELMCNLKVNKSEVENRFNISFDQYFRDELTHLATFEQDNLLHNLPEQILIENKATLLIRKICACFDTYTSSHNAHRFSKVV